jgi:hypothetical protein
MFRNFLQINDFKTHKRVSIWLYLERGTEAYYNKQLAFARIKLTRM